MTAAATTAESTSHTHTNQRRAFSPACSFALKVSADHTSHSAICGVSVISRDRDCDFCCVVGIGFGDISWLGGLSLRTPEFEILGTRVERFES